jgi:hypothetical protein
MAIIKTGNAAHDLAVAKAEGVRQTAVAAAATQLAVKNAEITFYRAVRDSCIANNSYSGVEQALVALKELGVNT